MQNITNELQKNINDQLVKMSSDMKLDDIEEINNSLAKFLQDYQFLIKILNQTHTQFRELNLEKYLNRHQKSNFDNAYMGIQNIDAEISAMKETLRNSEVQLKLKSQKYEEYQNLLNNKEKIERELREFENLEYQIKSGGLSAKNDKLIELRVLYAQKQEELKDLENKIVEQNQKLEAIQVAIQNNLTQKNYSDGLIKLEDDLNQVIKDYENNFSKNQKQNIEGLRYRIEFTKRTVGHMLSKPQYNKLDDMMVALDEMYADLEKKIREQHNNDSISESGSV